MSIVSHDDAHAGRHGQQLKHGAGVGRDELGTPETLGSGWTVFYLIAAVTISWLYYRNPGFWELVRHAHQWSRWARNLL